MARLRTVRFCSDARPSLGVKSPRRKVISMTMPAQEYRANARQCPCLGPTRIGKTGTLSSTSPRPWSALPLGRVDREIDSRRTSAPSGCSGLAVPDGSGGQPRQLGDVRGECGRVGRLLNSGSRSPSR
jgi:hypothetical protein